MKTQRDPRRGEQGSVLVVLVVVTAALVSVSTVTLISAQGNLRAAATDKFRVQALYAAESGLAAGAEHLRYNYDTSTGWTGQITDPEGDLPTGIVGNGIHHGVTGNPLSADTAAAYQVRIKNNPGDPGIVSGTGDTDSRAVLRSVGEGPNGVRVTLEMEVQPTDQVTGVPCGGYAQKNINEQGSGYDPCQREINAGDVKIFSLQDEL